MAIRVSQEIPVYEIGEKETEIGNRFVGVVQIQSHWNRDAWVVLVVTGEKYAVAAADLLAAIENARNVNR